MTDVKENFKSIDLISMVNQLELEWEGIIKGRKPLNPMLSGLPGIGKTEVVLQVAERLARKYPGFDPNVRIFNVSSKDATDLGIPFVQNSEEAKKKVVEWIRPHIFTLPDDWQGILFFDEFNLGSAAVQGACQQLFNDRRLDEFELPKHCMIVGAINPVSCNFNATPLSGPLNDRFVHYDIEPNVEAWSVWAMNKGVNPDLINFLLKQRPELFYDEEGMNRGNRAFATPRSWLKISEKIEDLVNHYGKITEGDGYTSAYYMFQGLVGQAATSALLAFLRDKAKYQDPAEIYRDGKDFNSTDLNKIYGCLIACVTRIPQDKSIDIKAALHNLASALAKLKNSEIRAFASKVIIKVDYLEQNMSLEDQTMILEGKVD